MSYRLRPRAEPQRMVVECARYVCDAEGRRRWACGALFDGPVAPADALSGATRAEKFEYAAILAIELCRVVRGIEAPALQALMDLVLVEIGSGLANKQDGLPGSRMN